MDRGGLVIAQFMQRQGQIEMGFRQIRGGSNRRFETTLGLLPLSVIVLPNPIEIMMSRGRTRHGQDGKRTPTPQHSP